MREIKFRIFDKNIPKNQSEKELKTSSGMMVDWEYVKKSSYLKDAINGKYPIMQYTGLKDKNKKEIYEGDVVIYEITKHRKEICVVEWSCDYSAGFHLKPIRMPNCTPFRLGLDLQKDYEIIGNIYENPELLEQKR